MLGAFRANWVVGAIHNAGDHLLRLVSLLDVPACHVQQDRCPRSADFPDLNRLEAVSLVVLGALSIFMGVFPAPSSTFSTQPPRPCSHHKHHNRPGATPSWVCSSNRDQRSVDQG